MAETPEGAPLNSAVLLRPDGTLVDRYDKINLVPFGEFVPRIFGFVNRITQEAGDFAPGNRIVVFPMGEQRLGVFICYESVFPDEVRQFVKGGANLLVNISNDGYFGHSAAREQHLEIARMRAVENSRWLIRVDQRRHHRRDRSGRARIDERLPPYQELVEHMHFAFRSGTTFYTNYGDWFAWGCLVAAAFALVWSQRPHYERRNLTVPDHKNVAVLDDVLFAFQAQQAFFAHARVAAMIDQRLPVHHFGADELLLEIAVDGAGGLLARVLFIGMVQARTSVSPAVRNDIRPSSA